MTGLELFARGPLSNIRAAVLATLMNRTPSDNSDLVTSVASILADVKNRGDQALLEMSERFDEVVLSELEVPSSAWKKANDALDPRVRKALERAARNIHAFHEIQVPEEVSLDVEPGVRITRAWAPLRRIGVYAPGGRAAYPSSVLMGVVPAKAAGVDEVLVCSPAGPSGSPPDEVLAACAVAGADRLFTIGGAGAVAALTYGTQTIPPVDAVVGPGNRWVTEAKRQVAGQVVIDSPAGPSEVLVLADEQSDPQLVAHELMAQAEHDPDAACVLVTTSAQLAANVEGALVDQLQSAPRAEICMQAFRAAGAILTADSLEEAIGFTRSYAPEHLSIMTADATADAKRVGTAGTIFVGAAASVAFGDYLTGANHVLPTAGRARSFSGLSTLHYLRSFTIQEIEATGADAMADDVAVLARAEGLQAHGEAALARRLS